VSYDACPCATSPSCRSLLRQIPSDAPTRPRAGGDSTGSEGLHRPCEQYRRRAGSDDGAGNNAATLQIRWMPTCQSYYGFVSLYMPPSQIQKIFIWTQTERSSWYERISRLPSFPTHLEQIEWLQDSDLFNQKLYSPLIYSPSDLVSAHVELELTDGSKMGNFTGSYSAGIKQDTAS